MRQDLLSSDYLVVPVFVLLSGVFHRSIQKIHVISKKTSIPRSNCPHSLDRYSSVYSQGCCTVSTALGHWVFLAIMLALCFLTWYPSSGFTDEHYFTEY